MSYLKTKLNRKKVKYQNILSKSLGINVSEADSNILVICNGGLVNEITQELIFETFKTYGTLRNIFMIPEKSFSFVEYENVNDAKAAYDRLNNTVLWSQIKGPIYLDFIEKLPSSFKTSDIEFSKPPGLIVINDFITAEEEDSILSTIKFDNDKSSELKHRNVKHYGYEFKYATNNVSLDEPIEPIPLEFNFLWQRLSDYPNKSNHDFNFNFIPDQLTVNRYNPGQGIPPHVDTHSPFTDGIISLSLQSDIVMDFKNLKNQSYSVILPRRSLCIMSGESRYDWTHGITPRKSDIIPAATNGLTLQYRGTRTSLTFRKTRQGDCNCNFPDLCDSRKKNKEDRESSVKEADAAKLEENYVHEVYEKIASHFSETRHKPWPNVAKFMESFKPGSIVVDVGCGNGKYFSLNSSRYEIGCDTSFNLMQVCRERGFECFTCNCLNVPLRDDIADGCISIAVIHHLSTKERRTKAIQEIIRILRIGGKALIYVWAKNQERQNKKSSYLKQYQKKKEKNDFKEENLLPENVKEDISLPIHTNRTNFNYNDLLVPWKLKSTEKTSDVTCPSVFLRYYHVFEDDEIKDMCLTMDNVKIEDYYYDQGNWCILLEKIKQ